METVLRYFADAVAHYAGEEVRTRNVHVGEVGAVGLVHVEIDFHKRRMRLRDNGLEKSGRWDRGRLEEDLVPVCFKESKL